MYFYYSIIDPDAPVVDPDPNTKLSDFTFDVTEGKKASDLLLTKRAKFLLSRVSEVERGKDLALKLLENHKYVENKGLKFSDLNTKRHLLSPKVFIKSCSL